MTSEETPALVAGAYVEHIRAADEARDAEIRRIRSRQELLDALRVHFRGQRQQYTGKMVIEVGGEYVVLELINRSGSSDDFLCETIKK